MTHLSYASCFTRRLLDASGTMHINITGSSILEGGGRDLPHFGQGVLGVVKYYYILSCTASMFESGDF